jgi:trans-aconitate 2-methyltransferase
MTWDPAQYQRFKAERSRPFFDLLGMIKPVYKGRVVDLGCGTGEMTAELHRRLGATETLGIDSSEEMLATSAKYAGEGLRFERGDIASFTAEAKYDVVFSNAALHWLPDHPALFARLTKALRPGGQIAVQMPANHDHPSHLIARKVAEEEPFRAKLEGALLATRVLPPERYAEILYGLGFEERTVRLEVYGHVLTSPAEVVEWVKGATLTPVRARLSAEEYERFLERYKAALLAALPDARPYLLTYNRVMLLGKNPRSGARG